MFEDCDVGFVKHVTRKMRHIEWLGEFPSIVKVAAFRCSISTTSLNTTTSSCYVTLDLCALSLYAGGVQHTCIEIIAAGKWWWGSPRRLCRMFSSIWWTHWSGSDVHWQRSGSAPHTTIGVSSMPSKGRDTYACLIKIPTLTYQFALHKWLTCSECHYHYHRHLDLEGHLDF